MYKHNTFSEILKLLDRGVVTKSIEKHKSDKHSKGFGTWNQLTAMIFSQLSNCRSLRDLEIRFNAKSQCHYQLRSNGIKRSTLSDANKNRNSDVFRDIATQLISGQGRELKEIVSLLDSSIIRVDGRGSEWTDVTKTRHGKGLKLHVQCGADSKLIEAATITNTNVNDITEAQKFKIEHGKIYVFDRGYMNFNWWNEIDSMGAYFVTRIKKKTAFKVTEELSIEGCGANIVSDKVIELTNKTLRSGKKNSLASKPLRLVEVYDTENKKAYYFVSNLLGAKADEIAAYYKQRWGIELLFKWLKQNLKLTTFLSENENAIKIQIYVAIITYVLIGMFKRLCGVFTRTIDLLSWIKGAIFSNHTPLKPPIKKRSTDNDYQLSFKGI